MKKICILILLVGTIVSAQKKEFYSLEEFKHSLKEFKYSLSGIQKVVFSTGTSIKIEVGTTQELILQELMLSGTKDVNHKLHNLFPHKNSEEKVDKRKGLTAVYPSGKDGTNGLAFSISKEGGVLYITDLKSHFQRHGLKVKLPKNINISVDAGTWGSVTIDGFTGEVEVATESGRIEMKNVTGPITANAYGIIDIDFDKVSQASPITISSTFSDIDVAIPANTKADLTLRTEGTVYTNFDFDIPKKKGLKNVSGRKNIVSKLNNGGVKIYIKSSMGNIYLRKK